MGTFTIRIRCETRPEKLDPSRSLGNDFRNDTLTIRVVADSEAAAVEDLARELQLFMEGR